jgi:arsenate reductase
MAEGLLRLLAGDCYECLSAGAWPAGYVHPLAVAVMGELGVDISGQRSKHIDEFLPANGGTPPDVLISVCDSAAEECPTFPGRVRRLHWPFHDPIVEVGADRERIVVFRRVRDQIRARLAEAVEAGELEPE